MDQTLKTNNIKEPKKGTVRSGMQRRKPGKFQTSLAMESPGDKCHKNQCSLNRKKMILGGLAPLFAKPKGGTRSSLWALSPPFIILGQTQPCLFCMRHRSLGTDPDPTNAQGSPRFLQNAASEERATEGSLSQSKVPKRTRARLSFHIKVPLMFSKG